jgi:hypothetical protein
MMNQLTMNEANILKLLEKMGKRHREPIWTMHLLDCLRKEYSMNKEEACNSLNHLEEMDYLEVDDRYVSLTEQYDKKLYGKRGETMDENYTIEQKKEARFRMMEKIYNEYGRSENTPFDVEQIGEELNLPIELTHITANYLVGERLIEYIAVGGIAKITHYGIKQYENALAEPEKPSKHFPAPKIFQTILVAKEIKNIQIQQDTTNSKQEMNKNGNYDDIKVWIQKLEDALIKENEKEKLEELREDIELIRTNISSEKPNKKYIGLALEVIKGVLIGLASNAIFHELLKQMPHLIP